MIISEVPFYYFAEPIVRRFGILPPGADVPRNRLDAEAHPGPFPDLFRPTPGLGLCFQTRKELKTPRSS